MNTDDTHINQGSILIVDDSRSDLRLLVEILSSKGYTVRPTLSASSALTSAKAEAPELILLDVKMPDMDGYELCQQLKLYDRIREVPVIFISALDEVIDKVKAFSSGGVDFITKPIQAEEVLARVKTHMSLHMIQKQLKSQNVILQQEVAERKAAEKELRKHRDHLEDLVAARTAELQKANEKLCTRDCCADKS